MKGGVVQHIVLLGCILASKLDKVKQMWKRKENFTHPFQCGVYWYADILIDQLGERACCWILG